MNWQQETNFQTNMSQLTGFVQGTIKELADPYYGGSMGAEWIQKKLLHLNEVIEYVWANRFDRVVDLKEYSDPSLRIPLEK